MAANADFDVIIVGGGIVGCAVAWSLTKRGLKACVVEKGRIAGEQSGKNSGFLRKQGRDARELPMMMRSLELWRTIERETGADVGFEETGNLAVAGSPSRLEAMEGWLDHARAHDLDSRILNAQELRDLCPNLRPGYLGALYTPSDCKAEPALATAAIVGALLKSGAVVREDCHAHALLVEHGDLAGLVTEAGEIRARNVVVAAGLWSSLFLRRYGVSLPQVDLKITVGRTAPFDHGCRIPMWLPDCLVRPRSDGGLTIALGQDGPADYEPTLRSLRHAGRLLPSYVANRSSMRIRPSMHFFRCAADDMAYVGRRATAYGRFRNTEVKPNAPLIATCAENARRHLGLGDEMRLVETWACRADMTPDGIPVIGRLPVPGLYVATGMSGHGFGISLGVGDALAQLVATGSSDVSLADFDISRFKDRYFAKPQNVL